MSDINTNTRRVRLTITSRHKVIEPEKMGRYASLFEMTPAEDYDDDELAPEDYPDEMNDALREIRAQNGEYEDDGGEDDDVFEEIFRRVGELAEMMKMEDDPDADAVRFCTEATLREREDGVIEIEYVEDESMDDTVTVILYDGKNPDAVTILHNGSVMSSLVCERRRRHISVYSTPVMPLEVAVYTRTLEGGFTADGGEMELDYIVELRGMDVQRTVMKIRADVMD
ncbi:MAG: DUF1934 domain-containing protein [Clostridia bacterium]|nr:DUF1934 domain-containing protein [Clostridia bacterium]